MAITSHETASSQETAAQASSIPRVLVPYAEVRSQIRDADLLLFRRRGLISIAGRGEHSHAAKAAWWGDDLRQWRPMCWADRPPLATALEPVSDAISAEDAQLFLEGFNSQMLRDERELWVVAVPVTLRYEGDLRPGDEIRNSEIRGETRGSETRGSECALSNDDARGLATTIQPDQGFSQSPHRSR